MADGLPKQRSEQEELRREAADALAEMADGTELIPEDPAPPAKKRDSPLKRTQRIRISGRTIRSGLE